MRILKAANASFLYREHETLGVEIKLSLVCSGIMNCLWISRLEHQIRGSLNGWVVPQNIREDLVGLFLCIYGLPFFNCTL